MWVLSAHPPLDDADARAVALSSDWRARLTVPYGATAGLMRLASPSARRSPSQRVPALIRSHLRTHEPSRPVDDVRGLAPRAVPVAVLPTR